MPKKPAPKGSDKKMPPWMGKETMKEEKSEGKKGGKKC